MSGVTDSAAGRLIGAVKPADSFISTEVCSTEICGPNPYEQPPGNIVGISDPSCASAAVTIAALGSEAVTRLQLPGSFVPLFPTSDSEDKSCAIAKASEIWLAKPEPSRADENS